MKFFIFSICLFINLVQISFSEEVKIPYKVKNFQISKCKNQDYLITITNVSVETMNSNDLLVSGSMNLLGNLDSPIRVSVTMKKKVLGLWVKVPCRKQLGSCTYDDVCQFGRKTDAPCPKRFEENNVPCRCPINKGFYTLPEDFTISQDIFKEKNVVLGKYSAKIVAQSAQQELFCYKTTFTLY